MHDFREQCQTLFHAMLCLSTMFYETIIRLGFCDIQKNQGLGKRYQTRPLECVQTSLSLQIKSGRGEGWGASVHRLRPLGSAANTYLDIDYSGYHKTLIQLLSFSGTKPNYCLSMWESYNHGQKSWDTFVFLRHFPIHIGPTPPLTPQTMLDACIQIFCPSFNFV